MMRPIRGKRQFPSLGWMRRFAVFVEEPFTMQSWRVSAQRHPETARPALRPGHRDPLGDCNIRLQPTKSPSENSATYIAAE